MKKSIYLILILILVLVGCGTRSNYKSIKATEATAMLDNMDSIVLVIGLSSCAACRSYKPVVEELVKNYDIVIYYVELDTDNRTDVTNLINKHLIEALYTPTTYIFKEGVLVDSVIGDIEYRRLKTWLEGNGVIE